MLEKQQWKNLERFPTGKNQWAIMKSGNICNSTFEDVSASLKKWNPFSDILFCSPKSEKFFPPLLIPELSEKYHSITKRKFAVVIIAGVYLSILSIVINLFFVIDYSKALKINTLIFLINIFIYVEYKFIISNKLALGERFLFFNFIAKTSTVPKSVFSLMLIVGVIQLYLSHVFHGNDYVIENFGLYYPAIEKHEYWRFIIGPFFHSSIEHWIVNATMLTITSFLLSTLPAKKSLIAIFAAIVISGYASYVYSYLFKLNVNVDAFAGVSGGIFYIFGFSLLSSIVDKNSYPERFWISTFSCALVAFLAPIMADSSTSHISHAVGFAVGCIFCAVDYSRSKA